MNRDLTRGRPMSVLLLYCVPLFGSAIFQQLYSIADSFVAGKFIDANALAAVGNAYEITLIYLAVGFGLNMGASIVTSELFGAKNYASMKTGITTAYIVSAAVCAALMALGIFGVDWLLNVINTPPELIADSRLYLIIYTAGLPFVLYYNICTGVFAALGDSKTPFYLLAASSLMNIGADILFVTKFNMGVAGVAWATFICQGISCAVSNGIMLRRLKKMPHDGERPALFSLPMLKKMTKIAVPSMLQQGCVSIGNIFIQSAVNSFGTAVIAGYSAAIKLNNFAVTSFVTIGNGMSNFIAQNRGAREYGRISKGYRAGLVITLAAAAIFTALYLIFSEPLVGLFMRSKTSDALKIGVEQLSIISPFFFVVSAKIVSDGVLRGMANMAPFMIGTFTDLLLRVALAFVFSGLWGHIGIWIAWPVGWCISTAMVLIFCIKRVKHISQRAREEAENAA